MANETNREKLQFLLLHAKGDMNQCAAVYQLIEDSEPEERGILLENFVKGVHKIAGDESVELPEMISHEEMRYFRKRYGLYIDQKITELLNEHLEEHEFYEKLAAFIVSDEQFQEHHAGIYAIYHCGVERRFPYHKVDVSQALTMDQGEFLKRIEKIGDDVLDRIDSALQYGFEQQTEKASVVLNLIDEQEAYEDRVIMMCRVLAHYEFRIMEMEIQNISDEISNMMENVE